MSLSLRPDHLSRYREVLRLIVRYGGRDLLAGVDDAEAGVAEPADGRPEELAADLERLGPTFIKLGQLLSSRPDLLPEAFLEPLARLQDRVAPFGFDEVKAIVEDELGVSISRAFATFEETPLAAASLGQVHRATLRDGREVAVKVQRPGLRPRILTDLEALDEIAGFLDARTEAGRRFGFRDLLGTFRRSLLRELDFQQEARNMQVLADLLADYDCLVVPLPVDDFTAGRVLTMAFIRGTKVTRLHPVVRLEVDGDLLAADLARAYLDQILVHGFVHADPHPGNLYLTADRRLALLDVGMVLHLAPGLQDRLVKLVLALAERRSDEVATYSLALGHPLDEGFDEAAFRRDVADVVTAFQGAVGQMQIGRLLMNVTRVAGAHGVRPAPELAMLGKTLFNLDGVVRTLAPELDPNEIVRAHAVSILRQRLTKSFSPGTLYTTALELSEMVRAFPAQMSRALETLASGEITLRVRAAEERVLLEHLQKIANRIALGLVLAALIVGAALLMRVPTRFTLLGYPGLAIVLFLTAAAFGFALVVQALTDAGRLRRRRR